MIETERADVPQVSFEENEILCCWRAPCGLVMIGERRLGFLGVVLFTWMNNNTRANNRWMVPRDERTGRRFTRKLICGVEGKKIGSEYQIVMAVDGIRGLGRIRGLVATIPAGGLYTRPGKKKVFSLFLLTVDMVLKVVRRGMASDLRLDA
jgi:hypothetical protein